MLTLFEKSVNDDFYVGLTIDDGKEDNSLITQSVTSVSLIETMLSSSTYLNVKFMDGVGEIMYDKTIIPDNEFEVTYGINKEENSVSKFKLSKLSINQMNISDMDTFYITADMIHNKWESLFKKNESRSWKKKKYSEVVEDIVKEIGIEVYDIEDTKEKYDVIQPNWTNAQMLKWLTNRSVNSEGIGGYVYFFRLDGTFVFKSLHSLYGEPAVMDMHFAGTTRDKTGFTNLTIDNNYMPTLNSGGFGIKYEHFDYDTKTYITGEKKITDIDERQLSDWYYIPEKHNSPDKLYYGGRDMDTESVSENAILSSSNSVQRATVGLSGTTTLKIGDIINMIIPISNKLIINNPMINQTHSGHWMIWKIVHMFDMEAETYETKLFISRSGINGEVNGLIQTPKGKDIV